MACFGAQGIMRYLSETPASRVNRLWFDRGLHNWSIDSERSLSPKRLPEAQFRAKHLLFFMI